MGQPLAALSGKGKCVRQDRPDLPVEFRLDELPRPVEAGSHRLGPQGEKLRCFLHAHALDHARHEDGPVGIRQTVGHLLNQPHNFPLSGCPLRIGARSGLRKLNDPGHLVFRVQALKLDGLPAAPQAPQRLIDRDPGKPGAKARSAAEPVKMREGVDIGVLDSLFGLAVVFQDAAGDPEKPLVVAPHNRLKCRAIPCQRPRDQAGIVQTGGAALSSR